MSKRKRVEAWVWPSTIGGPGLLSFDPPTDGNKSRCTHLVERSRAEEAVVRAAIAWHLADFHTTDKAVRGLAMAVAKLLKERKR